MALAKTDSRSQSARARARQAMAVELERARKRESKLVAVFSAIDARKEAEASLGGALIELRDLGVPQSDLAEMTGLATREVTAAIRTAKELGQDEDQSGEQPAPEDAGDTEGGAPVDGSESAGDSVH